MIRKIAWTLLTCIGVSTPLLAAAQEEPSLAVPHIVISTGTEGGGYWGAGKRLQTVAAETDLDITVLPSEGSLDNLSTLFDKHSPVNLAFAQADALQYYLNHNPTERQNLEILENLGQECVFIVTNFASNVETEEDLHDAENFRLGISSAASGVGVTFEYLASQIDELEDIEVVYGDTMAAMDSMGTSDATVDGVMMVSRPREHVVEVEKAIKSPHKFRFVKMGDHRLTKALPDGRKIYKNLRLMVPGAEEPVETICVRGLLLVNKQKLSGAERNQLTDVISYHWMRIYATP